MNGKFMLDSAGEPVLVPDLMTWATWYETSNRRVAEDRIGESRVSTVFLSIDHSWSGGPPVLWETMIFGGPLDQEQDRCSGSREQAEAMHRKMVERLRAALKGEK